MTTQSTTAAGDTRAEIRMGPGLTAPQRAVATAAPGAHPAPAADPVTGRRSRRRVALVAAALVSPVAMAVQYALNSAGLPRQEAEVYLTAVAANTGGVLASTVAYTVSVVTMVATAAMIAIGLRRRASASSAVAATLLTIGAVGAGGFVGLRLAALAFVEDGEVVPGGVAAFVRLQNGLIDQLGLLLLCAILGTVATVVAMLRSRADIGWWPAAVTLVGFVLASGEFPTAVSVVGALVQGAGLVPVARLALQSGR